MKEKLEEALKKAIKKASRSPAPPKLAAAMDYAIFPGGARVRPQLCLAVSNACGLDNFDLSMASAVSVEMMHCASLVHDDLPAFESEELEFQGISDLFDQKDVAESLLDSNDSSTSSPAYNEPVISGLRKKQ